MNARDPLWKEAVSLIRASLIQGIPVPIQDAGAWDMKAMKRAVKEGYFHPMDNYGTPAGVFLMRYLHPDYEWSDPFMNTKEAKARLCATRDKWIAKAAEFFQAGDARSPAPAVQLAMSNASLIRMEKRT